MTVTVAWAGQVPLPPPLPPVVVGPTTTPLEWEPAGPVVVGPTTTPLECEPVAPPWPLVAVGPTTMPLDESVWVWVTGRVMVVM